jgi:uncharacterized protein (DUF302 family)
METKTMTTDIGIRTSLKTTFDQALRMATKALKAEGFEVLTQIDVRTTLKDKLSVDFRRYVILGASNPALTYRAVSANGDVGLLLPCNVTVQEEGEAITVTAVNPLIVLDTLGDESTVQAVAQEIKDKLEKAITSLKG